MAQATAQAPFSLGFLLLDGFALMSFASATEPFRAANLLAGRSLYSVRCFSLRGGDIAASSGARIATEALPKSTTGIDILFVVAGGDGLSHAGDRALHAALRDLARAGLVLGGISGGPFVLAAAGLLDGRRFTIHWEHAAALRERWPGLSPERVRFVIDRDRITCGGGIAPLDLMHALIESRQGAEFARKVSDWFLHTHVDEPAGPQRASVTERYQVHHPVLARILEKMEGAIEEPLGRAAMAGFAGISERHLDRLFAAELQSTFRREYLRIRLERARSLLKQSAMPISEIAWASGFSGLSQFSRAFRRQFGENPGKMRK